MTEQVQLTSPPFDTVSHLHFSPTNPDHLLVASWDTTVRLYDTAANEQRAKFEHRAPVLDCCFSDASHAFSAGLDNTIRALDLTTEKIANLGQHNQAVSCLAYSQESNNLISGSWDRTLAFWDPRSSQSPHSTHTTQERVYHISLAPSSSSVAGAQGQLLVVAQASRLFDIYDTRRMDKPFQSRESSLKFMTRSLACMANGQGYATGSVEGRIAVEYFDPSPTIQEKKYAFKCHRMTDSEGVDHVWPVNALAFHPVYNTFVSGGSDCTISVWDHALKKRLRQYPKYPSPISALTFNVTGTKLAIGIGYTWDEGKEGAIKAERPAVWVRNIADEVKPKGWTGE